ncbi:hypothetical protein CYY_009993 [Polysphondylium violaceum]|uniref:TLDc domain-containing protein n=1 Tax=Polysphondylium violaceum TaxID=133409 RepID=A0A8J4UP41_9MYCE|nr:hypothetical protein CYY_009993 [Polysphondylium violaceum]
MTNEPNTYFIDRDGTHFNYILNYLRDEGDIQIPEDIRHCVRKEMEFYRINNHFKLDDSATIIDHVNSLKQEIELAKEEINKTRIESENIKKEFNSFRNNVISGLSSILNPFTFEIINDWLDTAKLTFQLLYRASENFPFSGPAFHSACDGKGATITVIKTSDGCIFGGYNSQSWNSPPMHSNTLPGDNKCFIFTLVNKHGIPPTKYLPMEDCKNCVGSHDFMFGYNIFGGCDIQIGEKYSFQRFPRSYIDTTGKGDTTLTPTASFTIKYLEIYKCT